MLFLLQASGRQSSPSGMLSMLLPFLLIFVVIYFLILRPRKRKEKELMEIKEQLARVEKNDPVVTASRLHSEQITPIRENEVVNRLDSRLFKANKKIVDENVCKICSNKFSIGEDIRQCGNCLSIFHNKCWDEKGGCNQHAIERQEETKPCPLCGKLIKKSALKCKYCGKYVDEKIRETQVLLYKELNDYLLVASGIGRIGLNVTIFIGIFIFGWLIASVFSNLGKGKMGWLYLPLIIICGAIGKELPPVAAIALVVYIVAWVHANLILTRYKRLGKQRLDEINSQSEPGIDLVLEKGIILHKVLEDQRSAINVLMEARKMQGGSPIFLNMAGGIMSSNKRYEDASEYFNRALKGIASEGDLAKTIRKNLAYAEKQMGKMKK